MGGMRRRPHQATKEDDGFVENVVNIYRCAKVVKGGRRFSFSALVTVGDGAGKVGIGYGKANEVPPAVEKGRKIARAVMKPVNLDGTTIPHRVVGRFRSSKVVLVPAGRGTGVIAGASVRAVLECAGVHDVLTKAYGSTSPKNLVKATLNGLNQLRTPDTIRALRGVDIPISDRRRQRIEAAEVAKLREEQAKEKRSAESASKLPQSPSPGADKKEEARTDKPDASTVTPDATPNTAPTATSDATPAVPPVVEQAPAQDPPADTGQTPKP